MVLGLIGFRNRDQWEPGKQFRAEDRCQIGRSWIIAKEDHVASESFAEDADKWYYLVDCRGLDDLDQKLAHLDQDIADSEQAIEESRRATVESREQTEASREALEVFNRIYGSFDSDDWLYAITDAHGMLLWGISRKDGSVFQAKGIPEDVKKWMDSLIKLEEIEHASYLYAITDSAGNVCWAINRDGSVYQPKGMPEEIKKILSETVRLNIIESDDYAYVITDDDDNVMFAIDHKGHIMVNGMKGVVNVESFKSSEYIYAVTDSQGNLLFGVRSDGTFTTSKFELPKDLAEQIASLVGQNFLSEDPKDEEFIYKVVDLDGNILFGIYYSGNMYMPKGMPEEARKRFEKNEERMSLIEADLEYVKEHGKDWSGEKSIHLPFPRVPARIEITGPKSGSKYVTVPGTMKYDDFQGNSFEKPILSNKQGNISGSFDKPNESIDILLEAGNDEDTFEIQFGNWPVQDSFHLKAYFSDFWKIRSLGVYHMAERVAMSRPYFNRRPWDRILGGSQQSTADALKGGIGEVDQDVHNGGMGHPDGFPVMLYWNGEPMGLYTLNLKKHKDNYMITKNDDEGKQLFFGDYMTGVFERYNNAYWQISNYNLLKLDGNGAERSISIPSYSSSSGAQVVMESAGVEGMTISITNSSNTYTYPVYYNGQPVTAENTWEAGDCVKILRSGTSDDYHFNVTHVAKKWNAASGYDVNALVYDEDTISFKLGGISSPVTVRRLFKLAISTNTTFAGYEYDEQGFICQRVFYTDPDTGEQAVRRGSRINGYNTMRPQYVNWKQLEMRNPKKTVAFYFTGNDPETGNPTYQMEYYNYDSPGDYASTGVYEYTHEPVSADMFTEKQVTGRTGTGETKTFSKKEYNRSVNMRKAIEAYSWIIPVIESTLSEQNLADWGFETEAAAKKAIYAEHHDIDFAIDFFLIYNLTCCNDSITHNTLYTMYDGQHLVPNHYDTDISMGMSSTYINAFPAVATNIITAGHTFTQYLWSLFADEIKVRWTQLRNAKVISASMVEEIVWEIVESIGMATYEQELKIWPDQPSYRNPVYWRMPAGSLTAIRKKGGDFKNWGYDESINGYGNMPAALKAIYDADPASVAWNEEKQYLTTGDTDQVYCVVGEGDDMHWYQCTANNRGQNPTEHYTCGNPTSGGVFDSPKRTVLWLKQRLSNMDALLNYEDPASMADATP